MAEQEEILRLDGISKSFFGVYALKNICLSLKKGQLLSLIGENGAGKSTMMNIIGGVLQPDSGTMAVHGQPYRPQQPADARTAGIAFIHQELNLFNNLSVLDNIFINSYECTPGTPFIRRSSMKEKVVRLLDSIDLHVSPDVLVERLSPGERQLVEIAKALAGNPDIIIFDEPTTSLTTKETVKLFDLIKKMCRSGKSIIYISHILGDVQELSDQIVVLRDGNITDSGPKEEFTIERMISSMVGRDIKQLYPAERPKPAEETLLEVSGLSQPGIAHDINFCVHAGEIVGIFGLMGSGRSELAQIIFGLAPYETGTIRMKGEPLAPLDPEERIRRGIAFVTENRREEGLFTEFSVYENLILAALPEYRSQAGVIDRKGLTRPVGEIIDSLHIKCGNPRAYTAKSLSGGNQQKVVLGKWLMTKPALMMVDEPTRGIDIGAKAEIYNILNRLAKSGTGTLMISSELEELIGVCNRILVMSKGEIVGSFDSCDFDREAILGTAFRQKILTNVRG